MLKKTLLIVLFIPLFFNSLYSAESSRTTSKRQPSPQATEVFVVGGIHQSHERAKLYTYQRMGQLVSELRPELLCVEVEQRYIDDGSDRGMPYDFQKFMVPLARKEGIPVVGIDWWDEKRGDTWKQLQKEAFADPTIAPETALLGGLFRLLNGYFQERDFAEINSPEITALWEAQNEMKYKVFRQHPKYKAIDEFEKDRNNHMVENILQAIRLHPGKRVLVAVGIDHKYYIERELRRRGIRTLQVDEVIATR